MKNRILVTSPQYRSLGKISEVSGIEAEVIGEAIDIVVSKSLSRIQH